jgi:peptidoglycan-associated lipoprotein
MRNILFAALIAVALVGCSTTATKPAPVVDSGAGTSASGAQTSGAGNAGVNGNAGAEAGDELHNPNSILSKRSVKDEYKPLVEAHARYLQSHPAARMTIQGNTDERGSREYNIALGQKRADAVKRMMVLLGAGDNQIETVSFGKEKPKNPGHDEAAWAENRRDDIVYAGE